MGLKDNVQNYLKKIPKDRVKYFRKIRMAVKRNLPSGYSEAMEYGMIAYVVPKSVYPEGYHADREKPLPFISIASQKKYIALYHMALYAVPSLLKWFREEYKRQCEYPLDMGKSCIRFSHFEDIPYKLIGDLAAKIPATEWISIYEKQIKKT